MPDTIQPSSSVPVRTEQSFSMQTVLYPGVCITVPPESAAHIRSLEQLLPSDSVWNWETVCGGIERYSYESPDRRLYWHIVRIDLAGAGLSVRGEPPAKDFFADGSVRGVSAENAAKRPEVAVSVNATPYAYVNGPLSALRRPVGLYVESGQILSSPVSRYGALSFSLRDGIWRADILRSQTDSFPPDTQLVFGGFMPVLDEGAVFPFTGYSLDSRICIGTVTDGTSVLILAVEKPFLPFSKGGASFEECAVILAAAGASSAVQMDGGSSAALYAGGSKIYAAWPKRRTVNVLLFVQQ